VQVAAADADRGDVDQDIAIAPFSQIEQRHANVVGPVNE
jgi:hypothetical protein